MVPGILSRVGEGAPRFGGVTGTNSGLALPVPARRASSEHWYKDQEAEPGVEEPGNPGRVEQVNGMVGVRGEIGAREEPLMSVTTGSSNTVETARCGKSQVSLRSGSRGELPPASCSSPEGRSLSVGRTGGDIQQQALDATPRGPSHQGETGLREQVLSTETPPPPLPAPGCPEPQVLSSRSLLRRVGRTKRRDGGVAPAHGALPPRERVEDRIGEG
ncbi:unnamed protein product [Discosporangium mesarthrocarpum]